MVSNWVFKILPLFTCLMLSQTQKSHGFRLNKWQNFHFWGICSLMSWISQNQHFLSQMFAYWLILLTWWHLSNTIPFTIKIHLPQVVPKFRESFRHVYQKIGILNSFFFTLLMVQLGLNGFWAVDIVFFFLSLCKD